MYLHKKDYEVRYTDVDFNDNIKLSALLSVMVESACLSADELGFGYSVLQPKNIGFILANWYLELYKPIKLGDVLTIHTWPIEPKKLVVFRDFELFVGREKVGVATSRWCVVDLATFNMIPAKSALSENISYNDFRSVEFNGWKIQPCISTDEPDYVKFVSYSDYDHYRHVNNTKYGDLLLDAFAPDELESKSVASAQISYVKQCKYGEKLELFKQPIDDGFYVVEGRVNGEIRIQLKIKFFDN